MVIPFFGLNAKKLLSAKSGQRLIFVWPFGDTNAAASMPGLRAGSVG
jgi:hypothetical protein